MSMQIQPSTARSLDADDTNSVAATLWRRLIPPLDCGRLVIETPAGEQVVMAGPQPGPQAWLTIYSMRCLWRLVTGGDMGFAESLMWRASGRHRTSAPCSILGSATVPPRRGCGACAHRICCAGRAMP